MVSLNCACFSYDSHSDRPACLHPINVPFQTHVKWLPLALVRSPSSTFRCVISAGHAWDFVYYASASVRSRLRKHGTSDTQPSGSTASCRVFVRSPHVSCLGWHGIRTGSPQGMTDRLKLHCTLTEESDAEWTPQPHAALIQSHFKHGGLGCQRWRSSVTWLPAASGFSQTFSNAQSQTWSTQTRQTRLDFNLRTSSFSVVFQQLLCSLFKESWLICWMT